MHRKACTVRHDDAAVALALPARRLVVPSPRRTRVCPCCCYFELTFIMLCLLRLARFTKFFVLRMMRWSITGGGQGKDHRRVEPPFRLGCREEGPSMTPNMQNARGEVLADGHRARGYTAPEIVAPFWLRSITHSTALALCSHTVD